MGGGGGEWWLQLCAFDAIMLVLGLCPDHKSIHALNFEHASKNHNNAEIFNINIELCPNNIATSFGESFQPTNQK